jgi:hypothetical protein
MVAKQNVIFYQALGDGAPNGMGVPMRQGWQKLHINWACQ